MFTPLIFNGNTAWGWRRWRNSLRNTLKSMEMRTHFMPPAVLPEQPPTSIHKARTTHVTWGHLPASSLNSPVVVINDTTENSDDRKACSRP